MNPRVALAVLLGFVVLSAGCATQPSIIPLPLQLSAGTGTFNIDSSTRLYLANENPELESAAEFFADLINQSSGVDLRIERRSSGLPANSILLVLEDRTRQRRL